MSQPVVHMDRAAAPALNTTVLQRFDPEIESVVVVASHVAMYENKTGNTEWVRPLVPLWEPRPLVPMGWPSCRERVSRQRPTHVRSPMAQVKKNIEGPIFIVRR
jgi:hypothetical protein